jgi:DNA-binding LytR/AlgR family response regulator
LGPHYVVLKATDKCLVLEDLLVRQLRFLAWCGSSAKIVSTAAKAIHELQQQRFDVVFLDRDLGLNAGFGEDVGVHLNATRYAGRVIVHSTNPFGVELIKKALGDIAAEIAPFDMLGVLRENA